MPNAFCNSGFKKVTATINECLRDELSPAAKVKKCMHRKKADGVRGVTWKKRFKMKRKRAV